MIRTYSELITLPTFEERFRYLKLSGEVGKDTFGYDRYLNQMFYKSPEWKKIRRDIILRDNACDLGIKGFDIFDSKFLYIHHMNPITVEDILNNTSYARDPEFLICTSFNTHNAIHYGDEKFLETKRVTERKQNDTCPWRK